MTASEQMKKIRRISIALVENWICGTASIGESRAAFQKERDALFLELDQIIPKSGEVAEAMPTFFPRFPEEN